MKTKEAIIQLLLTNSLTLYNINQIARTLNISVGGAHKTIKELEKKNIVKSTKLGNAIYYRLNFSNKETVKLAALILIENKNLMYEKNPLVKIYGQEIEKIKAKLAILFGSILTKKEKANDVDVLFVISKKGEAKKIYKQCENISKIKTKPIVPLILLGDDLKEKIEKREKIISSIIKEGIVLFGEDNLVKILSKIRWQI